MGWARIDDGFDDHPKILALLEHDEGGAAVGLWTLCLTWAHRNTRKAGKVPGLIPASLPRRYLGPGARDLAKLLVLEGLWEERTDEDGWQIHDFDRYLPTAETREARAEAGRRGAEARWGKHAGRDSNLPSDDGKPIASDGSVMASDGSGSMFGAEQPPAGTSDQSHSLTDGNKPSPDSNLPSGLPSDSGKPIASDGSRAPARRAIPNGIAPEPAPIPVRPTAAAGKPRPAAGLTITQRSKQMTDAYAEVVPLCKWPAVNGVVIRAIKAEKYSDDEIFAALMRLAAEPGRSVTIDALRSEIEGLPARDRSNGRGRQESEEERRARQMQRALTREANS